MLRRRAFLMSLAAAGAASAAAAAPRLTLIMVDRPGCSYCRAWKQDILPGYASHPVGRTLPLRIVPIDGPWPDGIALDRAPLISPTFLLLDGGVEVARIEGYPGRDHFWPGVALLLDRPGSGARAG